MEVRPIAPTICQKWLQCPMLGKLSQDWEPIEPWTPYMLVGAALHAGLEDLLKGEELEDAVGRTSSMITASYQDNDNWPLDLLITLAGKGLKAATAKTGLITQVLEHETVIATEYQLGIASSKPGDIDDATCDLVTSREEELAWSHKEYILTDHKTSLRKDAKWIDKELLESEADHQMWDYAARWNQLYPDMLITKLRRHLLVMSPTAKSYSHEYELDLGLLEIWRRGLIEEWDYIGKMFDLPLTYTPMRLTSCNTKFGKCKMYDGCHHAHLDPTKMEMFYRRKGHGNA